MMKRKNLLNSHLLCDIELYPTVTLTIDIEAYVHFCPQPMNYDNVVVHTKINNTKTYDHNLQDTLTLCICTMI